MPNIEPEEEELSQTQAEFKALHVDMGSEIERLRGIATSSSPEVQHVYRELVSLIGTVRDVANTTCAALVDAEERLDDLEDNQEGPTESVLLSEDAEVFRIVFEKNIKFMSEAFEALDASPQRELLGALLRSNQELLERVNEIEEEEEEEGEGEKGEGEPEAEA